MVHGIGFTHIIDIGLIYIYMNIYIIHMNIYYMYSIYILGIGVYESSLNWRAAPCFNWGTSYQLCSGWPTFGEFFDHLRSFERETIGFPWFSSLISGWWFQHVSTPLKKYWSVGIIMPNIWKKHEKMFQTTNQEFSLG